MRARFLGVLLAAFACVTAFPALAAAQQSGIAGIVRDTSGGVLPGVTVEAASPALIEKVRTAVTDEQGRYSLVDLRPGAYTVTFTLPGFTTVRREGLVLGAAFTATVNIEMMVGAVEETITVTGEAPLVDIQRSNTEAVLTTEVLDATPNAWRNVMRFTALLPGVTAEQGGFGRGLATQAGAVAIHGGLSGEAQVYLEGVATRHNSLGGNARWMPNQAMVQEIAVSTGGAGADQQMGGIVQNVIQKSGGNTFSGTFYFHYLNESFSGENIESRAAALGRGSSGKLIESWDVNPGFGGPILRDRLWFYGSYRHNGNEVDAGVLPNLTPQGWQYTPDTSKKNATFQLKDINYSLRLTWQASQRNQFAFFSDSNPRYWYSRSVSATVAPEAGQAARYIPNELRQVTWKAPLTNQWLLEANATLYNSDSKFLPNAASVNPLLKDYTPADPERLVPATELSTGMQFRSSTSELGNLGTGDAFRALASASYVTGTHTLKFGVNFLNLEHYRINYRAGDMSVQLRNGVPTQLTLYAPNILTNRVKADFALYVQDRWTMDRLTVNAGVRYDYFNAYVDTQEVPANRWVGPRTYEPVRDIPLWHDVSPRLGAVLDLFGDGRTALKATLNRYVNGESTGVVNTNNPVNARVASANRTWTDLNGNFVPDCNFTNFDANGECGPISNRNFGQNNPNAQRSAPDVLRGFGKRGFQWENAFELQHQLRSNVSVTAGYYRRSFGNFDVMKNLVLGDNPSIHYDPYCITLPADSRLPNGGGNEVCGFYDIKPAVLGRVETLITKASKFGTQTRVYHGFDLLFNARFARGQFGGGTSTGRTKTNRCFVVNSPQDLLFCDVRPPFQTQVKLSGVYELPWYGIQFSGVLQSMPGVEIATTYVARNAEIAPSLGRNLSAGANTTVTLAVVPPGTFYADRWNNLDLRAAKIFRSGPTRLTVSLDIFNVFNSDGAQAVNGRYGPQYLNPTAILNARYYKASMQFDF
jgi:hypothetical protein